MTTAWHNHPIDKLIRSEMKQQVPFLLWFTGLSGSGKSTLAGAVERELSRRSRHTYLLDGDNVRHNLCGDLHFSDIDRSENIRRVGAISNLMLDAGLIVLAAFISPFKCDREKIRNSLKKGEFIEIFLDVPINVCEKRDPKGLYSKARAGNIKEFTGIDSPYEPPLSADLVINTAENSIAESVHEIITFLEQRNYV